MKKKRLTILFVVLLLILVIPIPSGSYKDGGTKAYTALTYKIVNWNRIFDANGIYRGTNIYPFPLNFLSIDTLFERENIYVQRNEEIKIETDFDVVSENTLTDSSENVITKDKADKVEYSRKFANMSIDVLDGWEYAINKYDESFATFGISFWPKGHSYGKITLEYYTDMFGVCGTELSQKEIKLAGHSARQGIYSNEDLWNFIVFTDTPGDYVFLNDGAEKWWNQYGEEAIQILESAVIARDIISKDEAVEIAKKQSKIKYVDIIAEFDYEKGLWTVKLCDKNDTDDGQTVVINDKGKVQKITYMK